MKKHFHVQGRYRFYVVERVAYSVTIDEVIEAEDQFDAETEAVDKAMNGYSGEEIEERYSEITVKECEPPPPPATDITIWQLPRTIAPTLFPEDVLNHPAVPNKKG